jgi:hypothetical protein
MLQAAVTPSSLENMGTICIVLDLSKPGNCIESLLFWLSAVREHCNTALKDLQNSKLESFGVVKEKRIKYWDSIPVQSERNQI